MQVAISHSSPGLVTLAPEVQAILTSPLVLFYHKNKCRKHQGCVTAARKHVNTHWVVTHILNPFLGEYVKCPIIRLRASVLEEATT